MQQRGDVLVEGAAAKRYHSKLERDSGRPRGRFERGFLSLSPSVRCMAWHVGGALPNRRRPNTARPARVVPSGLGRCAVRHWASHGWYYVGLY